ncbi:MAG: glutathione S-transferase N-terminal domain-containing protein [Kiloniellales bacterium]|nr:glutathione S-transferase N-terminal domain-containing protein [Kiloniellales bacterium]
MLQLYEVRGEDVEFRPSPCCWRIRMALAHKGLAFEPVPWCAVEKERIARSGGGTVPVLVDGDKWTRESWDIALYLETAYPGRPALFDCDGDRTKSFFLDAWITNVVHPVMARTVLLDQYPLLAAKDRSYDRERTKQKFGVSLKNMCHDPDGGIEQLRGILSPFQLTLDRSNWM